jgi:hypothetical protein
MSILYYAMAGIMIVIVVAASVGFVTVCLYGGSYVVGVFTLGISDGAFASYPVWKKMLVHAFGLIIIVLGTAIFTIIGYLTDLYIF